MSIAVVVPAGRIHRSVLLERGWTAAMVDAHLRDVQRIAAVGAGVSNKTYSMVEVERVEAEVREVKRAVAARADRVPAGDGPYTRQNTVPRATLIAQGWTAAHIKRLLGGPDYTEPAARGEVCFYGLDRVRAAEAGDDRLRARLEQVRGRQAAVKAERIEAVLADSSGVWRRDQGRWLVQVRSAEPGQRVTVARRDGTAEEKVVTQIVRPLPDGSVLVEVARPRSTSPHERAGVEHAALEPVAVEHGDGAIAQGGHMPGARDRQLVALRPVRVGQVMRHRQGYVVAVAVRTIVIGDDTPSLWGGHLLGHEGQRGHLVTYRPATSDEAAAAEEIDRKATAARTQAAGVQAAAEAIAAHVRSIGARPQRADPTRGQSVFNTHTGTGSGIDIRVDDQSFVFVQGNGMDGDDWSVNNAPGVIVWTAPLQPQLLENLRKAMG